MFAHLSAYRMILASNSPRRRELLAGLGLTFETRVIPGIDESYPDGLSGPEIAVYIALPCHPGRGRTAHHRRYHCVY